MTSELRPAVEVWWKATDAWKEGLSSEDGTEAAAAVIEADREAVRAEQAAELAKFKALAETLAGALGRIARQDMPTHRENGDRWWFNGGEGFAEWATTFAAEALRQYKEARDAGKPS